MTETIVDLVLIALLLLTSLWCMTVYRRLRRLRADQGEMATFIQALGEATARAEQVVVEMKEASQVAQSVLLEQQEAGQLQRDELARLVESANRVSERLEAGVAQSAQLVAEARARQEAAEAARHTMRERSASREPIERVVMERSPSDRQPVERQPVERQPLERPFTGEHERSGSARSDDRRIGEELLRALQSLR